MPEVSEIALAFTLGGSAVLSAVDPAVVIDHQHPPVAPQPGAEVDIAG